MDESRESRVESRERGSKNMRTTKCTSRTLGRWALRRSERGHKTILTVEHTIHSVTLQHVLSKGLKSLFIQPTGLQYSQYIFVYSPRLFLPNSLSPSPTPSSWVRYVETP